MKKVLALALALAFVAVAAVSGEFNWRQFEGATVKVMLVQHPYAEGIHKKIADFEKLTGIKVEHNTIPEENYMDKLATSVASQFGDPDVFMSGAYQAWEYAPAGYLADLDEFVDDPALTTPDYDLGDFFEGILGSMRWDLVPGHKVGVGKLWGIPIGFETNCLSYNKEIFAEHNIKVPTTPEELYAAARRLQKFEGEGTYGIAVRGTRNWATVNTGYLTTFANYGGVDMAIENGRLVSKLDSPESIKMTDDWVKMIRESGSPTWASYTWYQCQADLGARKAAILFDADILGYFANFPGGSAESGKLASAAPVKPAGRSAPLTANLWAWALSLNNYSKAKGPAWLFIQYFTGKEFLTFSVTEWKSVDTPRKSVFNNPEFQKLVGDMDGYLEMFEKTIPGATILFTPNPYHFEVTTEWAATLQDIVAGKYPSTEAAMKQLKQRIDVILEDVELE
ncbi:MAG: sugar ABC transporter substrate-binding protein [Planctomycetota bacterium]|jgi:multiple sugar transport system substrate-binding protein|nr:sugar ABC transporter substrate-binding protein [Planctomycetota bacterium]